MFIYLSSLIRCQRDSGMFKNMIFVVNHRVFSTNQKQRFFVVHQTYLTGGHQRSSCVLTVGGKAAVTAFALSIGIGIYGLRIEHFGNIFMGTRFVVSKVQELVAVADDAFPIVFKHGFELRQIL